MSIAKKQVFVSATSSSVTETSKKDDVVLECVFYIHYLVQFKKTVNETQFQTLINSDSEVNAMTPAYASRLGLRARYSNVGAQKIHGSIL